MGGAIGPKRVGVTRRRLLQLSVRAAVVGAAGVALAACGGAGAPAPSGGSTAPIKANLPQSITTPASTSSDVRTASASASGTRAEPKGKIVYVWHTSLSPVWLDPQEYPPQVTPYSFGYAIHDALVKHLPGKPLAPSLAESYEVAQDYKSATFKLRPGIKFHDGSPVTPEDVKFSFEKYRGANAGVLHDKTERVEAVNDTTVRFIFKAPFLDFMILYGSPASGAGWVVPRAYYEKVGPNGFKQKPIGAGPYKFVRQQVGTEIEVEANTDYWRKVPSVKTVVIKGISEGATRVALLRSGEADFVNQIPGELIESVKQDPRFQIVPTVSSSCWLECFPLERPDSPLKDVRVRQAVSLALDRKAISDAEVGGYAPLIGNWIPEAWPGAVKRPTPPHDVAKAKQLLAEAGVPNGFEVANITPLPANFSVAERVASQLLAIGIRTKVNTMERGVFYEKLAPGPNRLKGFVIQYSGAPGDAAARIRENAMCKGSFSGVCLPEIEEKMQRYDASTNVQEREKLITEVQNFILDQYIMIPIYANAFVCAQGPRIANKITDVYGAIPQFPFPGPYEDIQLKES